MFGHRTSAFTSVLVQVAITEYQNTRLGGLNNKHSFLKFGEVRKYKIKVFILMFYANTFSGEELFPDFR